jgi:hypothetical protein
MLFPACGSDVANLTVSSTVSSLSLSNHNNIEIPEELQIASYHTRQMKG